MAKKKSKKGKRKKSKKSKKEPKKPFIFDINNFQVEQTRPGLLRLMPVIPENFDQVVFKLKILKNYQTGKPKYEIVYYDCRLLEDEGTPEDDERNMKVFSLLNVDTGVTLIVYPKKTDGKQPYIALDPVTNKEQPIDPHFMVHHDPNTGKNYLLDTRKFENGKLEFKDPVTQEWLTAELTERLDPLTGELLDGQTDDEEFVGSLHDGEYYVTKSEANKELKARDNSGNVVDITKQGYRSRYDKTNKRTEITEPDGWTVISVEGEFKLTPNSAQDEAELMKPKFTITKDPETGEIKILNEKGVVVEPLPNHYYLVEDPDTGQLELVDSNGEPVLNLPDFKIIRDPNTGRKILVDMSDKPIPGTEEMIIDDDEGTKDEDVTQSPEETIPTSETGELTKSHIHITKDPYSERPLFLDSKDQILPVKNIFEVIDPVTGKTLYFDASGNPIEVPDCPVEENTPRRTKKSKLKEKNKKRPKDSKKRENKQSDNLLSDNLQGDNLQDNIVPLIQKLDFVVPEEGTPPKSEVEQFFDDLDSDEARDIVHQVNTLAAEELRPIFLSVLKQVIELNQELIKCVLEKKLAAEKKFSEELMKEKQDRQDQFLRELLVSHAGDYDRTQLSDKFRRKLTRENDLLMDKMEARIAAENKVALETIKATILKDSRKVIKYTSIPCYRNFKLIMYNELKKNLQQEVKDLKNEVCRWMKDEKRNFYEMIEQAASEMKKQR